MLYGHSKHIYVIFVSSMIIGTIVPGAIILLFAILGKSWIIPSLLFIFIESGLYLFLSTMRDSWYYEDKGISLKEAKKNMASNFKLKEDFKK